MAVTVALVDAVTGEPEFTGREIRGAMSAAWFGKTAALPLGARSGVAWGTSTATITVSGTTVTIKPHSGVLALQSAVEASVYTYANDANTTLAHDAAHATQARKDLICALLDDPAESDGSSVPAVTFTITKGAEDGSNAVPATPARSLALAAVNIPASGGGASTITWTAPYAVAAGGIVPVRTATELAALWAAYPPTTDAIVVTARKDATAGKNLEYSLDGAAKYVIDARLSTATELSTLVAVYAYRVADAAALAALTGMRAGDKALQVDTGVTYRYSGAAWVAWESDWITWATAPTNITVGTGGSASSLQRYRYIAGRINFQYKFVLGTSGASVGTAPYMTVPMNLAAPTTRFATLPGDGSFYDSDTTNADYSKARVNGTTANQVKLSKYAGTYSDITATVPWTWAAGDQLGGEFWADPA